VQGKLRRNQSFAQEEAQSFCVGARKLILQDFAGFNQHVLTRQAGIVAALNACDRIQLVVAFTGDGISEHARQRIQELLDDGTLGEDRLEARCIEFGPQSSVGALRDINAVPPIDTVLNLAAWGPVDVPRTAYYGTLRLSSLVDLHQAHGNGLFHKNIRSFLGADTDVNASILATLQQECPKFFYLNNGVTILCTKITRKGNPENSVRLQIDGISVINGAQTIATASQYVSDGDQADISDAKLLVTLIEIPEGDEFGAEITKARNHQNSVAISDFAGLDAEQERLRTEVANLGIDYSYKGVGLNRAPGPTRFYIDEAAPALVMTLSNPKHTASYKNRPNDFLDIQRPNYLRIFNADVAAYRLVNAVKCDRFIQMRLREEATAAADRADILTYTNGNCLMAWLLGRQCLASINGLSVLNEDEIRNRLGQPFDDLRQVFLEETKRIIGTNSHSVFFRNQTQVIILAKLIMIRHFGIVVNEGMLHHEQANPDNYVEHLASLAPQIDLHG
jgi:hypothetical protein